MKKHTVVIVKSAITIGVFVFLFTRLEATEIFARMARMDMGLFAVSIGLIMLKNLGAGYRNRILLRHIGSNVGLAALVRLYFIGGFFNLFLPTAVGGDIARAFYLYRYSGGNESTVSTIIMERVLGILAMMCLSFTSVLLIHALMPGLLASRLIHVITVLFGCALAASALFFHGAAERFVERMMPHRLSNRMAPVIAVVRSFLGFRRGARALVSAFLVSLTIQAIIIASTWVIALSIGDDTPLIVFLMLLPIIWLVSMIPVSINGIGLREGAFVFFFGTVGMSGETALAISLIWFAQMIVMGVMGAGVFLFEGESITGIKQWGTEQFDTTERGPRTT